MNRAFFSVYAVSLTDGTRRLMAEWQTEANAEAIRDMAVIRRGVEEEFFVIEPQKEQE